MHHEKVLRLLGVDVHATRDDHVSLTVGQIEVSVGVDMADVAKRDPAIRVVGGGGLDRVIVVRERRPAGEIDLAARRQFPAVFVDNLE
jgi:hypothetical protein